jgi:hypothetical protein
LSADLENAWRRFQQRLEIVRVPLEIADTRRLCGWINALWMWRENGPLGVPTKAIAIGGGLGA